jgi:dephospho-CoA kinase
VTFGNRRWLISGGLGSGKSEVRRLLEQSGLHTIDADSVGHSVLAEEARDAVSARWPQAISNGEVDRRALAAIVFDDPVELAALEAITHPLIFGRIETELEGFEKVAVVEVPLIDTSLGWPSMVVDAPDEVRLQRAVARGMAPDDAERRMNSQPDRAEWLASSDLVIPNHGTLTELEDTVAILADYLRT